MTTPDPKGMARRLRTALADRDVAVSHSEALELVAHQLGARDWNTLAATQPRPDGHVVPVLRIFDETAALEFYVGYLDFRVDWRNDTGGHEPLYAQLSRGDARIHLSGHHGDGSPGSGVLVPVADALDLQLSLKAKEYAYANPGIEDRPWGRVVTVIDPFSNRIVFVEQHEQPPVPAADSEPRPVEAAAPIVLDGDGLTLTAIKLAQPSNLAGDNWIRWAHKHAVDDAHQANRALRARDRREARGRR